jgi:Bacterial regulatory protein, Fis family
VLNAANQVYSDEAIRTALIATDGNVHAAARKLKCDRGTLYHRIAQDEALQMLRHSLRQGLVDDCEAVVFKAAKHGNVDAAKWVLSHIGRDRGWGEHVVIEQPIGNPVELVMGVLSTIGEEHPELGELIADKLLEVERADPRR